MTPSDTAEAGAQATTRKNPHAKLPLGLPGGSVRALLTLLIVTVVVVLTVRDQPVGILWVQMLMIALAHYFTSRRLVDLPDDVRDRLEADGVLEEESRPLYLPKHTNRTLIVLVFLALPAYLWYQGRLWNAAALGLLISVFAYFLGMLSRGLIAIFTKKQHGAGTRRWADIKAIAVLGLLAIVAGAHLLGDSDKLPTQMDAVTVAAVLFYFGSR